MNIVSAGSRGTICVVATNFLDFLIYCMPSKASCSLDGKYNNSRLLYFNDADLRIISISFVTVGAVDMSELEQVVNR